MRTFNLGRTLASIEKAEKKYCFVDTDEFETLKDEKEYWVNSEITILVNDEFIRSIPQDKHRIPSALGEAIYGIIHDYNLVWYVLAPYTNGIFSEFEDYIALWEMMIDYYILEDRIIINKLD